MYARKHTVLTLPITEAKSLHSINSLSISGIQCLSCLLVFTQGLLFLSCHMQMKHTRQSYSRLHELNSSHTERIREGPQDYGLPLFNRRLFSGRQQLRKLQKA